MTAGKSDPLRALSDPLRMSLFELIKESSKTTPELAEILNENRINLYHHLEVLEKAGLIKSSYENSRAKLYSIQQTQPEIVQQKQATTIRRKQTRSPTKNSTATLILSPPKDSELYEEFKQQIVQAAKLVGVSIDEKMEILQVHINAENQKIHLSKRRRSTSLAKKKSK